MIAVFSRTHAQVKLEIGPQVNTPMGEDFSVGVGLAATGKYMVTKAIGVGLSVGYQHVFMASDWQDIWREKWGTDYNEANYNILPMRALFNFYLSDKKVKPYLGAQIGITKLYGYYSYDDTYYDELSTEWNETHFVLAPQAGLEIGGKAVALDVNVMYNGFDLNYLSCQMGIVINIGGSK